MRAQLLTLPLEKGREEGGGSWQNQHGVPQCRG